MTSLKFRGASASSSSANQWTYDVFLSFEGQNTRKNFIGNLYKALELDGRETYVDDEQLRSGEEIPSDVLLKAIEESRISVVVLSENYASSAWCLEELTKIFECVEKKKHMVLPVFDGVDPSDVQNESNNIKKSFGKLEERFRDNPEKVARWRAVLRQVGNINPRWHVDGNSRHEAQVIDKLVQGIASEVAKHPNNRKSFENSPELLRHEAQVIDEFVPGIAPEVAKRPKKRMPPKLFRNEAQVVGRFFRGIASEAAKQPTELWRSTTREVGRIIPKVSITIKVAKHSRGPQSSSSSADETESLVPVLNMSSSPSGNGTGAFYFDEANIEINEDLQLAGHLDGILSPEQGRSHLSNSPNPIGMVSPVQVPNLPSGNGTGAFDFDEANIEINEDLQLAGHLDGIVSPEQGRSHLSNSPNPIEMVSPVQMPNLPSGNGDEVATIREIIQFITNYKNLQVAKHPDRIEFPVQVPNLSSSPSGNGEQGSNSSISSNMPFLFLIGSVISLIQMHDLFKTHPANMWISEAALVIFCLSHAAKKKIDETHPARYSQIIDSFRVLSGTLVPVSLSSISLPHQLWWLLFAVWALLAFIVAGPRFEFLCTWIYVGVMKIATRCFVKHHVTALQEDTAMQIKSSKACTNPTHQDKDPVAVKDLIDCISPVVNYADEGKEANILLLRKEFMCIESSM